MFKKALKNRDYVDSFVYSVNPPNRLKAQIDNPLLAFCGCFVGCGFSFIAFSEFLQYLLKILFQTFSCQKMR